jgi:DnaJ domain
MARKKSFDDVFDPLRRMRNEQVRMCDHPGCGAPGDHRAPRSPDDLRSYYWFCLDHVQAYNRAWNYYADMDEDEIEAQIRFDTQWQRPTWPLGRRGGFDFERRSDGLEDPFEMFAEARAQAQAGRARHEAPAVRHGREKQALETLELSPPVTAERLKSRFKELVKKLHPDANGGDKDAEERLRLVIEAYAMLKSTVAVSEPPATV